MLRFFQKHMTKIREQIVFKTSHISFGWKVILFWVWICFLSLLFPWITIDEDVISCGLTTLPSNSSFSAILWHVWALIWFVLAFITFCIFSIQRKEKFHFFSTLQLSDQYSSLYGSLFIFFISLHSFFVVKGLKLFSVHIHHGQGIILCITWAIVIFAWSILLRKEYRKNIKWSYFSEIHGEEKREQSDEVKNNMKLPF